MQGHTFYRGEKMYVYNRKTKTKVYVIAMLSVAIAVCSGLALFLHTKQETTLPVMKEEESVVIALPDSEKTFISPFVVDANIVKQYFDGSDHEIADFTYYEGVYRPNQGIDYAYNDEAFDVVCMMDGEVIESKEDALFGNSLTIQSGEVKIVYQSLDALYFKVGDKVVQNDVLGKASLNVYNPELKNHLHVVVSVQNTLVNPQNIIGKSVEEIVP